MQQLSRKLGLFPATNIVIADMIGVGIFTTSGLLMQQLDSAALMLTLWLAGGILALCGALCYGELGAAMPKAGGEYVYLGELFHPVLGFLSGWVSFFVGFSAPLAASSIGLSEYLGSAFPALIEWGNPGLLKKAIAIAVILALAAVHLRGIESGARFQNYLTVGKVVLIAVLIIAGFSLGRGDLGNLMLGSPFKSDADSWKAIGLSLMWITFAYSGWNAAAYIGSEIRAPQRNLPRSLIVGTGIVLLLYLCLNALYVYAVPPEQMKGVIAIGGVTASRLFGGVAETLLSALIAFALLSAISALIILGPRVYYAMARDGYFFKTFSEVHPVFRVPSKSIALQCLIAVIMVTSGTFDQILTYMGFCLGIFPIFAVIGVFKLRGSNAAAYRMPAYPIPPIVFATTSALILVLAYFERPVESTIAVVTVALGLPFYSFFARSRQRGSPPDSATTA